MLAYQLVSVLPNVVTGHCTFHLAILKLPLFLCITGRLVCDYVNCHQVSLLVLVAAQQWNQPVVISF